MGMLKLPKEFLPGFGQPGVKPTGPLEIDWDNPLTRGLSHCFVFDSNEVGDLVTGRHASRFGDTHWEPNAMQFDESGDYLTVPSVTLNSNYSVLTHLDFDDNDGSNFQYFFSFGGF